MQSNQLLYEQCINKSSSGNKLIVDKKNKLLEELYKVFELF